MFSLPKNPIVRGLVLCLMVMLLFMPSVAQVQAGTNPLLTIFVAVMTGFIGVLIYDAVSCELNIFFGGCGGGGGGGGGSTPLNGSGSGNNNGGGPNGTGNNNGTGGGPNPVACTSTALNACSMAGSGFIVGGVCNATPPPNSACSAPVIDPDTGFYADPSRVRKGKTTTLRWDVTNATVCTLSGGGLSLSSLGITGDTPTQPINQKTVYSLSCQNGTEGGPVTSATATVNLIPSFEEI